MSYRASIMDNRRKAKNEITLFLVSAVIGMIFILCIIFSDGTSYGVTGDAVNQAVAVAFLIPFFTYSFGAGALGAKRTVGWAWRNIRVIPIGFWAIIIFIIVALLIVWVGMLAGCIAAPYLLYKARKTLRETE
ncbi:MAG: hypothetical protein LBH74_00700 [Nitrososphaerota archaeon]|nr:hypothetical protein [Nitrososphaerota archaeon]